MTAVLRSATEQVQGDTRISANNEISHKTNRNHVRSATVQVPAVYSSQLKHEDSNAEISDRTSQPAVCYNKPPGTREYQLMKRPAIDQVPAKGPIQTTI